jgi:hypothetical protein
MATFGEKAVGLTFNPSAMPEVDRIKRLCAEMIDMFHTARENLKGHADGAEQARLYSIAITEMQGAQMWGVKAATWRNDN